jgi:hypothetical protein
VILSHSPSVALSEPPTWALPEIFGALLFLGAFTTVKLTVGVGSRQFIAASQTSSFSVWGPSGSRAELKDGVKKAFC